MLLSWGAVRCFCACRVFATITLGWLYIFPSDSHTARQVQEPMLNGRIALCSVSSSTLMFHHLRFHLCHVQNGSASACLITDADFSALPTCWLCGVIQRPRSISVKLRKNAAVVLISFAWCGRVVRCIRFFGVHLTWHCIYRRALTASAVKHTARDNAGKEKTKHC